MKRILCVILVLLLFCPILLLPAAAAEPEEYVFEYVEPVMPLGDDFDFETVGPSFSYNSDIPIPVGYYCLSLSDSSGCVFRSLPFYFFYSLDDSYDEDILVSNVLIQTPVVYDSLPSGYSVRPFRYNVCLNFNCRGVFSLFDSVPVLRSFSCSLSFAELTDDGLATFAIRDYVYCSLVPYSPITDGLIGSLSEEPYAVFSHVLSLLPIVIPCLVSFIAIRKAINYVRSKIKGA